MESACRLPLSSSSDEFSPIQIPVKELLSGETFKIMANDLFLLFLISKSGLVLFDVGRGVSIHAYIGFQIL